MEYHYMRESAPDFDPAKLMKQGFTWVHGVKGESTSFDIPVSIFTFLFEGELMLSDGIESFVLKPGQMVIFPSDNYHTIDVLKDCTAVYLCIIGTNRAFCNGIFMNDKPQEMTDNDRRIRTLPIVPPLQSFADQIAIYIQERNRFKNDLSLAKQQELQVLLGAYYPKKQLQSFLAPLCGSYGAFYDQVMAMGDLFLSADEMADRMGISRSTFIRHFNRTFKMTPKNWSKNLRCNILARALRETSEPLAELSERLHFSSQQRMSSFCKENLGNTPRTIRTAAMRLRRKKQK